MNPALGIGRDDEPTNKKRRRAIKQYQMDFLTFLVRIVDVCKRKRVGRRISRTKTSLQQEVTLFQLSYLAVILTLPQLVIQLCRLCIPSLRSEIDIDEGDDMYISSCYESSGGEIMRWVGVVLAIIPFIMLIMLSIYSGGLP